PIIRNYLSHAEDDDGFVVEAVVVALEAGNVGVDGVGDLLGGVVALGAEKGGEAVLAVHFALGVVGVDDAVGDEDEVVTGLGGYAEFLIGRVGEHAKGETFGLDGGELGGAAEDGLDGAG